MILDVDMYKLCIDDMSTEKDNFNKELYTKFKCSKCGFVTYLPNFIIDFYINSSKIFDDSKIKEKQKIKMQCAKCSNKIEIVEE